MSQLAGYAGRAVTLADLEPRSTSAPLGERRPTVIEPAAIPSTLLTYDGNEGKSERRLRQVRRDHLPRRRSEKYGTSPAALAQEEEEDEAAGPDSIDDRQRRERGEQCAGAGQGPLPQVRGRHEHRRPAGPAGQEYWRDAGRLARQNRDAPRRRATTSSAAPPSLMPLLNGRSSPPKQRRTPPAQSMGVTAQHWRHAKDDLGACVFEQKWADQVCSELVAQVTVGCLEHGRLVDALRERFGNVFDRVCRLHSDALWQLDKACGEISSSKDRIEELEKLREEDKVNLEREKSGGPPGREQQPL